jgi:probable addiction module antidote protein
MPKRTRPYRSSLLEDLQNPTEAALYLNAALDDSDEMFLIALRDVAEARQMAKVAQAAGIARESIYRSLASGGNPTYSTLRGVLRAVGMQLEIVPECEETPIKSPIDRASVEAGMAQQPVVQFADEIQDPNARAGLLAWHKGMGIAHTSVQQWPLIA